METKKWYQSRTIVASIIGVLVGALSIVEQALLSGSIDQDALIMVATSAYAIYGRIKSATIIE